MTLHDAGLDVDGLLLDFDRILEFDSMLSLKAAGAEGLARAYDKEDMQVIHIASHGCRGAAAAIPRRVVLSVTHSPTLALTKHSPPAVLLQSVAASARSLLVFACTQGWPATARVVLPAACMDLGSAAAVVAALEEQLPQGVTLLILAVSSQCVELVSRCLLCGGVGPVAGLLTSWGCGRAAS